MTDRIEETQGESGKTNGLLMTLRSVGRLIVRNPIRTTQFLFFFLVGIIILQNLESTSIDVLFWSITSLPKLVLIFLSMVVGAAAWELVRRLKPRS